MKYGDMMRRYEAAQRADSGWRKGQALYCSAMGLLREEGKHEEVCKAVDNTENDPFYEDKNIKNFIAWLFVNNYLET